MTALANDNGDVFSMKRPEKAPVRVPEGAMPPYNLDIERALLGMVLHDPEQLHEILQILAADDFFRDAHQIVFRAIKARYDAGKVVDFRLVIEDLDRAGDLKRVGGDEAFEAMSNAGQCSWNAVEYAQVVKNHAIARNLIDAGQETLREGYARQFTGEDLLARAEERIFAIAKSQVRDDTANGATIADEAWEILMRRSRYEVEGVQTGLCDIDRIIGCLPNGALIILAARPAMGKTSLGMNICEHNFFEAGVATLFISLEMQRQDLGLRLLASQSRVPGSLLKRAYKLLLPEYADDMGRLAAARDRLRDVGDRLIVNQTPGLTVSQIAANARLKMAQRGIGLLVIDYMSLVGMQERRGESRQETVARTSRQLKDLAKMLNIPVLVLCQLNRLSENREDHRPRMSDLRESGQIEQDADLILLLHRPEYYDRAVRPGEADVLVAKNRNGETGTAHLAFSSELTRFDNLARPDQVRDDYDWRPED
jgi:replicative DNA helicase